MRLDSGCRQTRRNMDVTFAPPAATPEVGGEGVRMRVNQRDWRRKRRLDAARNVFRKQ